MNRATHDEMLDLVAVHALGALPAGEAAYASAHIALCDECRAEYEKLRPAADAIALEPDNILHARDCARMKNRLMTAVRQTPSANRISRQMPTVGALIALAAAIVFGFFTIADQRKMHDLELAGAKTYAVADGEILKTPQRVVLVMRRLPPLAPGRTYQAWTLAPGAKAVAPSVTFTPDSSGYVIVSLPQSAARVGAVAVSVEPAGGSRSPTTKPLFVQPLT